MVLAKDPSYLSAFPSCPDFFPAANTYAVRIYTQRVTRETSARRVFLEVKYRTERKYVRIYAKT